MFSCCLVKEHNDGDDYYEDSSPKTTMTSRSSLKSRTSIHNSILETIGKTPLVHLPPQSSMNHTKSNIYLKLESENPGGSVKDRLSIAVIEWAEHFGKLEKGQTVVEASSGNTGIGMAMVCAKKGYPYVCVMAESFSIERRKLMRFLGAKVVVSIINHYSYFLLFNRPCLLNNRSFIYFF